MNSVKPSMFSGVHFVTIDSERENQRLDNFLLHYFNGVPRSHIYKMVRKGEVRINKKRASAASRLHRGDIIRLPPVRFTPNHYNVLLNQADYQQLKQLTTQCLFENDSLLVFNKPAGLAVHGGSTVTNGVIELLRSNFALEAVPQAASFYASRKKLELIHRLDQDTSGCLMVAKNRAALHQYQSCFKQREISKHYVCLLHGHLPENHTIVEQPLQDNVEIGGEKLVVVDSQGKPARTEFTVLQRFADACLVKVKLITGRKHQIRVHSRFLGHPILGDKKYGDKAANSAMRDKGLRRLFLHAAELQFPVGDNIETVNAPLPTALETLLTKLSQ